MTETEPQDAAPPWPIPATDTDHPFGPAIVGAQLCALCAAQLFNAAWPVSVETATWNEPEGIEYQRTQLQVGAHRALLAAGCWPEKFRVRSANGEVLDVVAITTIAGTQVCKWHIQTQMPKLGVR